MTIFSGDELYDEEVTSGPHDEDPLPWDDGYDDDPGGWLDANRPVETVQTVGEVL